MRAWSTCDTSRLRHGDLANINNKTQGIFLKWRRRSTFERLFRNSCLYLECRSTTGESPVVVVILMSRNLNVHEDSVIWDGTSLWALVGEHLWFCLLCAKKNVPSGHKIHFPYPGHHKSQITKMWLRHTNTNEIWECSTYKKMVACGHGLMKLI